MDEAVFQANFPNFPAGVDELQKLSVLLRTKKVLTKEEWDTLRKEKPEPRDTIREIAIKPAMQLKDFADMEATLLNVPFVDLDSTQIPAEVLKIFKIEVLVESKAIPIKLTGPELLIGMVSPGNQDLVKALGAQTSLGLRPAKILLESFEKKIKQMTEAKKPHVKKGPRKRLGDILVESKYCTDEQLKEAIDGAKKEKTRLGAYLVKKGTISNKQLSIALSKQFDIPFIDLEESLVDPVLASLLPKKLCYDQILCPVKREEGKLIVAMTDPTDIITIDHIEMMTGMRISPVVSSELSIMSALGKLYGESVDSLADAVGGGDKSAGEDDDLGSLGENDAPIIKLVNLIVSQAIQLGASDIHVEPYEDELRIRLRKDGILKLHMKPTRSAHAGLVSRIKIMAGLDIAETRLPQDGRVKLSIADRKVDLRVSCVPCIWGEKVCMRILDQGNLRVNLGDLGFEPHMLDVFMEGVKAPNGIVLVTGPTGSGKTTTLYSSLFLLNNPGINIMTAEDPVEYNLMGINQVQCHADIGLDFGAALRSFLRQDPNVIMIGEIRDFETASIAIKAAMTGHLVISTLHTNDAPSTVARLLNMGLEPFSLTTSLRVVEAQRLVRKICKACYTEYKPSDDLIKTLGINKHLIEKMRLKDFHLDNFMLAKGAGCPDCDHTGYRGRQGVYEVLSMTNKFRELVENRATPEEMRRQALRDGMLSLRESALYKLLTKRTTVEEVMRTTMEAGGDEEGKAAKKPVVLSKPSAQASAATGGDFSGNLQGLTREIQEFKSALDRLSGGTPAAKIDDEILRRNLADPLANIQTQVQSGLSGGDFSKILPFILAQGQKLDFNVKNLLHHFSEVAPNVVPLQLNELVEKEIFGALKNHVITARLLSGTTDIGQGLKLSKNLSKTLPPIACDPDAFRVIACNLLINSLMALGKGGEIKVMSRAKPGDANHVELVIFDNGQGIPVEEQPGLFAPFHPIGRKTLGLGLAVVRKLLSSFGAKINLKSVPGTNTLVTIEFPVSGNPA